MISQRGIDLIKQFEGCRLEAYPDPSTGQAPWTIGYGQTNGIEPGMKWTQEQADYDLFKTADALARRIWQKCSEAHFEPTSNQLAALTSFAYNLGWGTLVRVLAESRKQNRTIDVDKIPDKMLSYNLAGGKVLPGLKTRREQEVDLFKTA